jgi:hypothetical protein
LLGEEGLQLMLLFRLVCSDAVYSFLRAVVDSGSSTPSNPAAHSAVDAVLRQCGQALADELMKVSVPSYTICLCLTRLSQALQDELSRTQIRNLVDLVRSLLSFSRALCSELLPNALAKLPSSIPKKNELCQRLLNATTPAEQREALLDLEDVVRRDAKRH